VVITMGCGDACPIYPGKRYEDWELQDPAGQPVEVVRRIRDDIDTRVQQLLGELVPAGANHPTHCRTREAVMRLVVIGGSDAGIAAALRARELDPSVEATVVVADAFPNFSICGLPYHLSGDVPDWRSLTHRTTADLEQAGIQLPLDHTPQVIDPARRQVTVTSQRSGERQLGYDRLVIGTGAVPARPPIDGLDLDGVHVLHTMADTFALHQALTAGAGSAIIVGGGYIGLEMAEAFTTRGLTVTFVEQAPAVMPTVDLDLGRVLGEELGRHGVQVVNDVTVKPSTKPLAA
jgi:NADPH-dependent 2,4-dienoyl-CoA reductase/sulfur reductase-like enzyme